MSVTAIVFLVMAAFSVGVWTGAYEYRDDTPPDLVGALVMFSSLMAIVLGAYLLIRGMVA